MAVPQPTVTMIEVWPQQTHSHFVFLTFLSTQPLRYHLEHQGNIFFPHFTLLLRSVVLLVKIKRAIDVINNYSFLENKSICKNLILQSDDQNKILFPTQTELSLLSAIRSKGFV